MRANEFRKLTVSHAMEINQPVMVSLARTHIFAEELGRDVHSFRVVENRHVGVMRAVLVSQLCDVHTTARTLIGRIQLQNGVGRSAAREHLYEAESLGLVCMEPDNLDRRKNWWGLRPGILQKLNDHGLARLAIADVIRAQIDDPMNKDAGRNLINPDYYFNILDPVVQTAARRALTDVLAGTTPTSETET